MSFINLKIELNIFFHFLLYDFLSLNTDLK